MNDFTDENMAEYVKISNVLKNVSEKINKYKENINQKIIESKNEEDKRRYVGEYNNFISLIQNDPDITRKFTYLRSRQEELKNIINETKTNNTSDNNHIFNNNHIRSDILINKSLTELKSKYSS